MGGRSRLVLSQVSKDPGVSSESHREWLAGSCQEHKGQVSGTTGAQDSPSSLQGLHTQVQITALLPPGACSRGGEQAP